MTDADLSRFVLLVREMRYCQKRYFATRSQECLEKSKKAEREVDAAIRQLTQRQEPNLFDSETSTGERE